MERRTFLQGTAASAAAACISPLAVADDANPSAREIYELRTYSLAQAQLAKLDDFLAQAYLPAVKHHGVRRVGAFLEAESSERDVLTKKQTPTTADAGAARLIVLLVHGSAEGVVALAERVQQDKAFQKAAAPALAATPQEPLYRSCSASVLTAFAGMPKMTNLDASKPRLLNLRTYESHNERAAAKKVEMFEQGELEIFRRVGLTPVFFASTVLGGPIPSLTYMLTFPDDAARGAAWKQFVGDPAWKKLSTTPGYGDAEIVSKITNRLLSPRAYSEI